MQTLSFDEAVAEAERLTALLRNLQDYYLVCHETKTKLWIGAGVHTYEYGDIRPQSMMDFLHDTLAFPLVVEIAREAIAGYASTPLTPGTTPPDTHAC